MSKHSLCIHTSIHEQAAMSKADSMLHGNSSQPDFVLMTKAADLIEQVHALLKLPFLSSPFGSSTEQLYDTRYIPGSIIHDAV